MNSDPNELCHRKNRTNPEVNISGKYGTLASQCDSPTSLLDATFDFLRTTREAKKVDFIIYTGDTVRHDRDNEQPRTTADVLSDHAAVIGYFQRAYDLKNVKLYPTIGNNDEFIHNNELYGHSPLIQNLTKIWEPLGLDFEQDEVFMSGGYYMRQIHPKLSIISLNSFWLYRLNPNTTDCESDYAPGSIMLEWFEKRLRYLSNRRMHAYVIGHIPPKSGQNQLSFFDVCYQRYLHIVATFRNTILHHFHGHTNYDMISFINKNRTSGTYSLTVLNSTNLPKDPDPTDPSVSDNNPIVTAFSNAPSVISFNNPAIRVYHYDTLRKRFGSLLDFVQYYTDVEKDNKRGSVKWEIEYSAREAYGINDLSVRSLVEVVKGFYEEGSKTLPMYRRFFNVSSRPVDAEWRKGRS
ncbi:Endopolyphosphatase [Dinochytrium kinnereticum]|nr:Endopolyphosphatase [Dinochytrium kinnereticum]